MAASRPQIPARCSAPRKAAATHRPQLLALMPEPHQRLPGVAWGRAQANGWLFGGDAHGVLHAQGSNSHACLLLKNSHARLLWNLGGYVLSPVNWRKQGSVAEPS